MCFQLSLFPNFPVKEISIIATENAEKYKNYTFLYNSLWNFNLLHQQKLVFKKKEKKEEEGHKT